jgi:hypothetical protein
MTTSLHIENRVRDYDSWKRTFDKFDRFRSEGGVRGHRVSRDVQDPASVAIDLDFDTIEAAAAFREKLLKVWASPQSHDQLSGHASATVREILEDAHDG